MQRQRKRANPLRIFILLALIAGVVYVNQMVVPNTPPLFIPTTTPTRSPESFLNDAAAMIKKGKINLAIETYKEAVKADPENPATYVTLARWQVLYGDYEGAMENVQNALLLNPNHALAHAVSGWVQGKQGKYLEGIAEIKNSLELDPNSALAYAYWSEILKDEIDNGKEEYNTREKAGEYSRKAMELDSSLLEVRRARGLVLEVTGNYEEAIVEFEAAVKMNDNLADLHIALGRNYKAAGTYDQAVEEFNKAIALKPEDPAPYAEQARTYLTLGEFAKGAQLAEQAVGRAPADPSLHALLGTLYFKSGDYKTALKSLALAVNGGVYDDGKQGVQVPGTQLDTSLGSINLYSRYGLALANVGDCSNALQVSQKIFQVDGSDENAAYNAQVMVDTCKQQAGGAPAGALTGTPEAPPTAEPTPKP